MKKDYDYIESVLSNYLPSSANAFIFGSRAGGKYQRYSDYDIGIECENLSALDKIAIESEFEDSDFPYKVDVVDFNQVSAGFKEVAKKIMIPLNIDKNDANN